MRLRRALLVVLIAACALPAHADYKRSYALGVDAYGAGKLDDAEKLMKEALADEATPAAKVKLYGMRFEPYVPQFYLGMLAYKRGDCAGAMRYWEMPGVNAIVSADGSMSSQAAGGQRDCKAKLGPSVAATNPEPTQVTPPPKPPEPKPTPPPEPKPTPPEPKPTPPTPTPTPTPIPTPPPKPSVVDAPNELVAALDSFLLGRYKDAANVDPSKLTDSRAKYHALLVRAAARHVMGLLQGESGSSLIAQAQADVRAAKALQPGASPDASVFSPRFRQFYTATR
jgi:hypothetical protein